MEKGTLKRTKRFQKLKTATGVLYIIMFVFIVGIIVTYSIAASGNEYDLFWPYLFFMLFCILFVLCYVTIVSILFTNELRFNWIRKDFKLEEIPIYFDEFIRNERGFLYMNIFAHGVWDRVKTNALLMKIVNGEEEITDKEVSVLQADASINKYNIIAAYILRSITYVKDGNLTRNPKIFYDYSDFRMIIRLFVPILNKIKEDTISTQKVVEECSKICNKDDLLSLRKSGKEENKHILDHEGIKEQTDKLFNNNKLEKTLKIIVLVLLILLMVVQLPFLGFPKLPFSNVINNICTVVFEAVTVLLLYVELIKNKAINYLY